ncbi:MAG: 4'-phosphopantetheinyl transferase superfamily protein [Lewinellaceae bacterium]|nr:4'-phosphopantetheinyl transferase superfamily protein [Lewinella sp.]MCB9280811.1 4'-phosphopantetheinyl transferase superfamily protein [Lewinellaceae bacterium]
MIRIYCMVLNRLLPRGEFHHQLETLPQLCRDQILALVNNTDRHLSLSGKLLVREGLKDAGMDPGALQQLQLTLRGKPFIPGGSDFNITHSGDLVACAFSTSNRVGLDIEKIIPVDLSEFQEILRPDEWEAIQSAERPQTRFFTIWTQKEAVIKAEGEGFFQPIDQIEINRDQAYLKDRVWFLTELSPFPEYIGCLATDTPSKLIQIKMIDQAALFSS